MENRKDVVFDIRNVGQSTVYGELAKHFNGNIPSTVLGWEQKTEKEFTFYFIVPEEDIERVSQQCAQIELRAFFIISNKGMLIGG